MYVEVESNPNCGNSVFLRFRELGPARPVGQVRVFDCVSTGEWGWVTGWQDDASAPRCPAVAQPVADSGAGVGSLGPGGSWGIRARPPDPDERPSLARPPHRGGDD